MIDQYFFCVSMSDDIVSHLSQSTSWEYGWGEISTGPIKHLFQCVHQSKYTVSITQVNSGKI